MILLLAECIGCGILTKACYAYCGKCEAALYDPCTCKELPEEIDKCAYCLEQDSLDGVEE